MAFESCFKKTKNDFYFTLKALIVLKIFRTLSWHFGHVGNGLIRKIRLISKSMTSQPGKQTIAIHIFTNTSKKSNQAMKFGQLIEYNMGNIFLEKSYTKCRVSHCGLEIGGWGGVGVGSALIQQFFLKTSSTKTDVPCHWALPPQHPPPTPHLRNIPPPSTKKWSPLPGNDS